jgi:DNA-directed RNA polymerase specialized sigma24 family protein
MVPLPTGKPLDPVAEGYLFLCNYARTAIHAAQRRAGPLHDHDDIVQQICLEWLQQAGPPQEAFPRLLDRSPAEMQLLRETVNRVIARVIYQQRRGRRLADLVDWPAPVRSAERDWIEFQSDCAQGVGRLSPLEWQVLELRRQGKTFAEIGTDLGVARQRVWEVYHEVEARLRKIYATAGG